MDNVSHKGIYLYISIYVYKAGNHDFFFLREILHFLMMIIKYIPLFIEEILFLEIQSLSQKFIVFHSTLKYQIETLIFFDITSCLYEFRWKILQKIVNFKGINN